MGVQSGPVKLSELVHRVVARPVHPDWLPTRAHRRIDLGGRVADVRILDGGHAVSWSAGPHRLVEILSGPGVDLPDDGLLAHSTVRGDRQVVLRPFPGLEYQASVEVERIDPALFRHLSAELELDASPGDLLVRGPRPGRMSPAPLSRIHVEPVSGGLAIHVTHTYPEEHAILHAQSIFQSERPGRG